MHCVYKPVAGEAPLWDFPDGTLAGRELGAVPGVGGAGLEHRAATPSFVTGRPARAWCSGGSTSPVTSAERRRPRRRAPTWSTCCPPGRCRPGYLPVLQAYDYAGDEVTLVHADDARLRRMAVFDVLINNADRKGGHILRRRRRPRLRRRPRRQPARRGQAAHRAVGLGGQAGRRRHAARRSPALRRRAARRRSATTLRAHITAARGRRAACQSRCACWTIR